MRKSVNCFRASKAVHGLHKKRRARTSAPPKHGRALYGPIQTDTRTAEAVRVSLLRFAEGP